MWVGSLNDKKDRAENDDDEQKVMNIVILQIPIVDRKYYVLEIIINVTRGFSKLVRVNNWVIQFITLIDE